MYVLMIIGFILGDALYIMQCVQQKSCNHMPLQETSYTSYIIRFVDYNLGQEACSDNAMSEKHGCFIKAAVARPDFPI